MAIYEKTYTQAEVSALAASIKSDMARRIIDQLNAHCICMDCAVKAVETIQDM